MKATETQKQVGWLHKIVHCLDRLTDAESMELELLESQPECLFKVKHSDASRIEVMESLFKKGKVKREWQGNYTLYQSIKAKKQKPHLGDSLFI